MENEVPTLKIIWQLFKQSESLFPRRIMKGEVSVLDRNIFCTFISNWIISEVISDIGSAENSLHRIVSQVIQFNKYL